MDQAETRSRLLVLAPLLLTTSVLLAISDLSWLQSPFCVMEVTLPALIPSWLGVGSDVLKVLVQP